MTIQMWLDETIKKLETASVPTARLDAEVLLADALKKDRSWLHANPDFTVQGTTLYSLNERVDRRATHEPLAYIRGKQEFFGRDFAVSPDTLTPRPETETLVEIALKLSKQVKVKSIADLGTGSGCIIISLVLEHTANETTKFTGYDVSESALEIAKINSENLKSDVEFIQDDITLNGSHKWQEAEMILANLPYVPDDFYINLAAGHEPKLAIFGGNDGLDYYRKMFEQLNKTTAYVLCESMPPQHDELKNIAYSSSYSLVETRDFIQLFKRK